MINPETLPEHGPISQGEHWLQLIDREQYRDIETAFSRDGVPILFKDFHLICGEHAEPLFVELESTPVTDPGYEEICVVARSVVDGYLPDHVRNLIEQ